MGSNKVGNGNGYEETHANTVANSHVRTPRSSNATTIGATETEYAKKTYDSASIATGKSSLSGIRTLVGRCSDDPRTSKGRRRQLMKILGLAAVPIVILVIQSSLAMNQAILQHSYATSFKYYVDFATQAADVVHSLGLERGTTTFYVSMQNDILLPAAVQRRKLVDQSLIKMTTWPDVEPGDNFYTTKQDLQLDLAINRMVVNQSTPLQQLNFFTDIIAKFLMLIGNAVTQSQANDQSWQQLAGYQIFISAKEAFAAERSCGTVIYGQGNMSLIVYLWYQAQKFAGFSLLNKSIEYNPYILQHLSRRWYGSDLERNITIERDMINHNNLGYKAIVRGQFWYASMTNFQNILLEIEKNLTANITANLNYSIDDANQTLAIQIFILVLSIILFPSTILLLHGITGQIQRFASILQMKNEEVMKEKRRTEAVLNQLLPRQVAEKLRNREVMYPESYDQVTIFFSDVVQFTDLSAMSTPLQVVDTLNMLYTIMDRRIEAYDVYKVETIGDAYLCASGLPERNGNKHSYEIASMSLELVTDVAQIRIPHKPDYELRLRIGLNTGPCVAGIVGLKMPRYCLFGDTVNTASRMESHGEPLRIHITTATHDCLRFFDVFEMESRGEIIVKGKGPMHTWWLLKKNKEKETTKRPLFGPDVQG